MSILRVWTRQFCWQVISRRSKLISSRFCSSQKPIVGALKFSEEVLEAKAAGKPLVALESTIITHGMPYPHNLETARKVEDIIRSQGAVPATIAILKGELTIGLSDEQLEYLSQAKGVVKSSRRDLAPIIAAGLDGATTVAGTIIAAEIANIPIFVTGGIGGVHREGETTLDISADLTELGRSKTLVVCSGVKSILDIGRTLEFLETQGVCVCAFGESKEFPAFYTPRSGFLAPHSVANAKSAAALLMASRHLGLTSGVVVAVPVPEHESMDESVINMAIVKALKEADAKGIKGKEVTPYILGAVAEATSGRSLATNIALIKNNARVGAEIAVEFNRLLHDKKFRVAPITSKIGTSKISVKPNFTRELHTSCTLYSDFEDFPMFRGVNVREPVLVIGGSNVDRTYTLLEDNVQLDGSTHPCVSSACAGGVGRNMAEALWRLRGEGGVRLLTAVGDDSDGQLLDQVAPGLLLHGCVIKNGRTASYASVMDSKGECLLGLGDMDLHKHISVELVDKHLEVLKKAPLVVLDGNPPQETVDFVLELCQKLDKHVFFEPTDKRKAAKALRKGHRVSFTSPNTKELSAMIQMTTKENCLAANTFEEVVNQSQQLMKAVGYLILTMGTRGVMVASHNVRKEVVIRHYPVKIISDVVNVSGAGDCFASGFVHAMLLGLNEPQCISVGLQTAKAALYTKKTVPHKFTLDLDNKTIYSII